MKTSKKLHKQTIRGILSNRFYIGEMYSGGQYYPQCGGYRTREENGVEKVREALKTYQKPLSRNWLPVWMKKFTKTIKWK